MIDTTIVERGGDFFRRGDGGEGGGVAIVTKNKLKSEIFNGKKKGYKQKCKNNFLCHN